MSLFCIAQNTALAMEDLSLFACRLWSVLFYKCAKIQLSINIHIHITKNIYEYNNAHLNVQLFFIIIIISPA